ncbi:MAG: Hydrolase, TatD family [Candidatus Amesbacteria bacterium GW2011_GWB1_47_26]|uniref:Hydrolase, TatD family n=1 Tax=Candidatus Amesbacteria bacterium GW2011_GWC2_45_19 TaxID=1618366 RepID=A0A0G1PAZ8_9BACT|nr:MAG: Hydrolase, TatD family [Candidatus Amesbacteria bacterium GW2011_GWC2_45_19]KKU69312.1 MAG: Hydrolase, TatD family [Microgenomates group bacterium GW2011_GWC1_47_20]KKU75054.1 MAG: Hydrolase, TatD family [Candidatus Amesbacteria bacterium GW2011_GWB1_47_26]
MIDSHCHLQEFEDLQAVIGNASSAGITGMICCGTDVESSKQVIQIAKRFESVYATIGVHPESNDDPLEIENLINFPKVVAIGECGLDTDNPREIKLLKMQVDLAKRHNLPLMIHNRKQDKKILEILGDYPKVILHCFTGDMVFMKECVKRGWYISFGGIVTFKSSHGLRDVAKAVPEDKLLVETDAPYITPEPLRGTRNEPRNVKIVAAKIAEIRGTSINQIEEVTARNARRLFGIA